MKGKLILFFLTLCFFIDAEVINRAPASTLVSDARVSFSEGTFENGPDRWGFWQNSTELGGFEVTNYKAHSGSKCGKLTIKKRAAEIWHVQLVQRSFSVEKNQIYRFAYWARGENGAGVLEVAFVKGSPPWTFYSANKIKVSPEWKRYEMIFTSPVTTTDIQVAFQCAYDTGDYYIDDISFTPEGKMELRELAQDWYTRSEERIDSIRKDNFILKLKDKKGSPLKGTVEVKLVNHQFEWGTCLSFGEGEYENKYRKIALDYFNSGVFENAFKWEEYEKVEGKPRTADLDRYLKWSKKNEFPIRGHTLIWGTENYGFDKHWPRLKSDELLKKSIHSRIIRDLSQYRGKIREYDVWNEPIHEPSLFLRLGWEILDSAFIWAHMADPEARLFINEYSIISGGDAKIYRDLVEGARRRGVPIHGIGVQGHFSSKIDPLDIASKMYYMAELGLPLKITEFDMDIKSLGLSEKEMAVEYAKMMRTAFSHPAVEGFLFWGFWDARHWRPGAGIFDHDLKAKIAADSVFNLIHKVWSTSESLKIDSSGQAGFKGFYGTYDVKIKSTDGSGKNARVKFLKAGPREIDIKMD